MNAAECTCVTNKLMKIVVLILIIFQIIQSHQKPYSACYKIRLYMIYYIQYTYSISRFKDIVCEISE